MNHNSISVLGHTQDGKSSVQVCAHTQPRLLMKQIGGSYKTVGNLLVRCKPGEAFVCCNSMKT